MHIYRKNLLIIITLCLLLATIFTKDIGVDAKHTDNSLLVSHQKTSTKSADKEYVTPKKSEDLKLHSKGAVVMDASNGNILFSKNPDKKYYPASCTKILTAIVVLEKCKNLKEVMTVSDNAVHGIDPSSSHIALDVGEKITVEQGLYGLLLCSGNDCAVTLAEHVGGSVDNFSDMMNKKAKELGLNNSHFENPHGLFGKNHYTTPSDLAKIMYYCVQNPKFVKIYSAITYVIPKTNKSKKRELWNNHRMIKYKYYAYNGVIGGKSGYIYKSQFNLITCAKRDNLNLIAVNMRCANQTDILKDTKHELDCYFKEYKSVEIPTCNIDIGKIYVKKHKIKFDVPDSFNAIIPKNTDEKNLKITVEKKSDIKLPVKKGQVLGVIKASDNGKIVGITKITSSKGVTKVSYAIHRTLPWFFKGLLLIFVVFLLILRMKFKRRYRRKKRRRRT